MYIKFEFSFNTLKSDIIINKNKAEKITRNEYILFNGMWTISDLVVRLGFKFIFDTSNCGKLFINLFYLKNYIFSYRNKSVLPKTLFFHHETKLFYEAKIIILW